MRRDAAAFAQDVVALVRRDAQQPVLEGRVAPVLPQLEISLRENFLANVLKFRAVARKARRHAEHAPLVPPRQLGIGIVVARQRGRHELLIRRRAVRGNHSLYISTTQGNGCDHLISHVEVGDASELVVTFIQTHPRQKVTRNRFRPARGRWSNAR